MKYLKLIFGLLILSLLISSSVFAAPEITRTDTTIFGLRNHADEKDILKTLGTPTKVLTGSRILDTQFGLYKRYKTIFYNGLIFALDEWDDPKVGPKKGIVFQIYLTDRSAVTARGLAVGDSASRVTELYGTKFQEEIESYGPSFLVYSKLFPNINTDKAWTYRSEGASIKIYFYKDKVSAIEF